MAYSKTVLVLAPHTDDGELGCGATISKLRRQGAEIFYTAFSSCEDSLPVGAPKDMLIRELHDAMATLNIPKDHITVLPYQVRYFNSNRQSILNDMIRMNRDIAPDMVFLPSVQDIHQDHATIAIEGLRAFKKTSIYAYEAPWNNYSFQNQAFSVVEEQDILLKIQAIACYISQHGRGYANPDYTRSLLVTHGVQVGVQYAEVFEIPRLIF